MDAGVMLATYGGVMGQSDLGGDALLESDFVVDSAPGDVQVRSQTGSRR